MKINKQLLSFCLFIVVLFCIYIYINSRDIIEYDSSNPLYDQLMNDFSIIFPDENRNSGGVQFYNYIETTIQPSYQDFLLYNQYYCGVSGSPIDPERENRFFEIIIPDLNNNLYYGKQYICCTPCVCDMIRFAKVEKHSYQDKQIMVFTINDPCEFEKDIPNQVTSFQCVNKQTKNASITKSGRVIVGVLHDAELFDEMNPEHILALEKCEELCEQRNSQSPDELVGGMGDIFVKLATVGNQKKLNNIYGEPLQTCQLNKDPDNQGSWDKKGYCSELGGGVHQICMNVNRETSNFSTETGQSDWSEQRVGNNHCMCLGAWALYKQKGKGTGNELQCESIPEIALSKKYTDKWNTWNGNELPDQIVKGVDSLVEQCYLKNPNQHLKQTYDKLRQSYSKNWSSILK